jgi:hypothetical protein
LARLICSGGHLDDKACPQGKLSYAGRMKFFLAVVVYLLISVILGWGILLAVKGNPWLLIVSFLAYAVAFGKIGCLPGKPH